MKVLILSSNSKLYSTRRLREACLQRGHKVQVIDFLRAYVDISAAKPMVMYRGKRLAGFDAVVPRSGAGHTFYVTAIVRQFEMMGVWTANSSQSISRARDKLRSLQILSRRDVGLPITAFAHSTSDVDGIIELVGGAPLVVKLLEGMQGVGVVLAETRSAARSVIEAFRGLEANILVQQYIKESGGSDLRCFVVGDRVVASMIRFAAEGDFRANLHRGGHAEKVKLTKDERSTAVRAAKALGLQIAGVDILRSRNGPLVIEVNSSPGLEGIEQATGIDVAGKIIEHVEKNAKPGSKTGDAVRH
jgi:ribosomal protein S6--L-glutamate ligase